MNKNEELTALKKELLAEIAELETVVFYKTVVDKLKNNQKILQLIDEKKDVQQQLVNIKRINKDNQREFLEAKMEMIERTLTEIPLYQQYLSALSDTQEVLDIISACLQEELSVEQYL